MNRWSKCTLALCLVSTLWTLKALSRESEECSRDGGLQKHDCGTAKARSDDGGVKNGRAAGPNAGNSLPASFLPPPRSIADITAVLDSEKPDPATLARTKSAADAEPSDDLSQDSLAQFYYARSEAREILGRSVDAL